MDINVSQLVLECPCPLHSGKTGGVMMIWCIHLLGVKIKTLRCIRIITDELGNLGTFIPIIIPQGLPQKHLKWSEKSLKSCKKDVFSMCSVHCILSGRHKHSTLPIWVRESEIGARPGTNLIYRDKLNICRQPFSRKSNFRNSILRYLYKRL